MPFSLYRFLYFFQLFGVLQISSGFSSGSSANAEVASGGALRSLARHIVSHAGSVPDMPDTAGHLIDVRKKMEVRCEITI